MGVARTSLWNHSAKIKYENSICVHSYSIINVSFSSDHWKIECERFNCRLKNRQIIEKIVKQKLSDMFTLKERIVMKSKIKILLYSCRMSDITLSAR